MALSLSTSMYRLANLRVILALAAIFGLLSAQAGRGTLAYFTDSATSTGNTFTTVHIDIALKGGAAAGNTDCSNSTGYSTGGGTTGDISALWNVTAQNAVNVVKTADVCVKNVGNSTLSWTMDSPNFSTSAGALKSAMRIVIWSVTDPAATCAVAFTGIGTDGGYTAPTAQGTVLYGGGSTDLASVPTPIIAASQLTSGSVKKLCFSTVLPSTASETDPVIATGVQGQTISGDFRFAATSNF